MKIDRFVTWCQASGLRSPLKLKEKAGYRYVSLDEEHRRLAENDNNNGFTNLVNAPMDVCMTSKTSDGLADRLLFEQTLGEDSFFAPYLDVLPSLESFQATLPRFWSEERWALVEAGDGGSLFQAHEVDLKRLALSCDDWAQACVDSRCNFLPGGEEYSLTPMLDMINHDPTVKTRLSVEDDCMNLKVASSSIRRAKKESPAGNENNPFVSFVKLFSSNATPKQEEGNGNDQDEDEDEVFISYGDLTDQELLLSYGFVLPNNAHNQEIFNVQMIRQSSVPVTVLADGSFTDSGLGQLRRYLATSEELQSIKDDNEATKLFLPFLSERNEIEVMALVGGTLEEMVNDVRQAARQASDQNEALIASYLRQRYETLKVGLQRIQSERPDIFG